MDPDRAHVVVTPAITPEALILRIVGDVDADTSEAVQAGCRAAVAAMPPPTLVIVDLLAVGLLSAAAVRLFLQFTTTCSAKGLQVYLVAAPGSMPLRILTLTGLSVPIFPTVNDAFGAGHG
ncbi:STAS domain-containing protein [Dactylosporangium sp. NPDC000521]|uniref:STAS domain-containing protein n=1 Tax=Dactylosporangium sp. NPDC000521 TaxID=3363975 RepID=UPI0036CF42AF